MVPFCTAIEQGHSTTYGNPEAVDNTNNLSELHYRATVLTLLTHSDFESGSSHMT